MIALLLLSFGTFFSPAASFFGVALLDEAFGAAEVYGDVFFEACLEAAALFLTAATFFVYSFYFLATAAFGFFSSFLAAGASSFFGAASFLAAGLAFAS